MYNIFASIGSMSRKQRLCWFIVLASIALLAFDKLTGGEWVTIVTLTYSAFSAANITDKHLGGKG